MVIEPIYNDFEGYSHGVFALGFKGKEGFINEKGKR